MTARSPPRLAIWLLEGLGGGAWMDELIGDLTEQFAQGRSQLWFWYQAGVVLLIDFRRTLRKHALSFIAAVLVGYAVTSLSVFCYSFLAQSLDRNLDLDPLMRLGTLQAVQLTGTALLFVYGWIVTRIHRAHARAVVIAFVIAVIAPRLPPLAQLTVNVMEGSRPLASLVPVFMPLALQALSSLVAGFWVTRNERFFDMNPYNRFIALLTLTLAVGSSILHDAGKVGVLIYPASARYPINAAEVACGVYLVVLLWRRDSRSTLTKNEIAI